MQINYMEKFWFKDYFVFLKCEAITTDGSIFFIINIVTGVLLFGCEG